MQHGVLSGSLPDPFCFSFGVAFVQGRVDRIFVNLTLVATSYSLFCFLSLDRPLAQVQLLVYAYGSVLAKGCAIFVSHISASMTGPKDSIIDLNASRSFYHITTLACLNLAGFLY